MSVVYVAARREGGRKNEEGDGEGLINYFREGGESRRGEALDARWRMCLLSLTYSLPICPWIISYPFHAYRKPIRERESR